jgi:hypothetical protein
MIKAVSWAVAFATRLLLSRAALETGIDPITAQPVRIPNANIWPPHRPRPTFPRQHKRDPDRLAMAVVQGRIGFTPVTKLVGGKGLRP